jgi:hypothetical protein
MVASNDRVLVARAGEKPLVLDLDAKVVAEPDLTVGHINELVAMCFKHARTAPDFLQILGRWMNVVREVIAAPNGLEALPR